MRDRVTSDHRESLDRLDGDRGVAVLVGDLLAHRGRGETLAGVRWGEPGWRFRPDGRIWWGRPLTLALADARGDTAEGELLLPWLLDDRARETAAEVGPVTSDGQRLYVGDHDGCYAGRPLVPITQAGRRPGVHLLQRPLAARLDDAEATDPEEFWLEVELWPVHGAGLGRRHGWVAGQCDDGVPTGEGEGVAEVRAALGCRRWVDEATAREIAGVLGVRAGDDVPAALGELVANPSGRAVLATAPSVTVLRHLGDVLMDVVFAVASRSLGCGGPRDLRAAAHDLTASAGRALHRLVVGRGRFGALLVPEIDTDTLARLEHRRTVTFLHGTHGQPGGMLGRTDLRQLHPDWAGRLCPLQTPESQDIGLVRFRAAGPLVEGLPEAADRADLSLAAGLIPFVGHDDPARSSIGAKNLKQAVPVLAAMPPLVRTGLEEVVAEEAGVLRAPLRGRVEEVTEDAVVLVSGGRRRVLGFGPAWPYARGAVADWTPRVARGAAVSPGDLLAVAPDVHVGADGRVSLALGIDALVALVCWDGLDYEDGVVVSASFADRMTSLHERTLDEEVDDDEELVPLVAPGMAVDDRTAVAEVRGPDRPARPVHLPEAGVFHGAAPVPGRAVRRLRYRLSRRLAVGDKLSNRHGGKGVVSRVLPDGEMPRTGDGRVVEVVLNPLGVLRRLNVGQILEMNVGLLAAGAPVTAGRVLPDRADLAARLAAAGALGGRLPLRLPDGTPLGPPEGVVVGPQYLVKLDHMAVDKLSARRTGARSPRTGQPRQAAQVRGGRRTGSAQRLGEMELWALQAAGVPAVLADALQVRGVPDPAGSGLAPTLRAVDAHLRVAGLHLAVRRDDGTLTTDLPGTAPADVTGLEVARPEADAGAPTAADGTPLRTAGAEEQAVWGRWRPAGAAVHPLHDETHGSGDAERAQVRWVIPLAVPVLHPWEPPQGVAPLPDLAFLPVLPPAYRVAGTDPLDRAYLRVCRVNARIHDLLELPGERAAAASTLAQLTHLRAALVHAVRDVLGTVDDPPAAETVAARLAGKGGLLRRWLLGRATDRSGRAVIVPDPDRDPQTLGVPRVLLDAIADPGAVDEHRDVVVLNRQPTLHPYNLQAFRAEPVDGHAVHLHPLVLAAIAGDHDGDTVALHWPATATARREAWDRLRPARHLVSAAAGGTLAKLDLDIAVGLVLGSEDAPAREELAVELGVPVDGPLTPGGIRELVATVAAAGDPDDAVRWTARLQRAGWRRAAAWGFSVADLPPLPAEGSAPDVVAAALRTAAPGSPLGRLAQADRAGAAGGVGALAQLLVRRGRLPGPNPLLPAPDCPRSLLDGLTADQLRAAAAGGIGRLAEKKLVTPVAGALTKALAELAYDVAVTGADCGSDAPVRSPLSCRDAAPCAACYGPDLETGDPVRPGRRVGLLAAAVVGERGTQLAMKTFHGGGTRGDVAGDLVRLRALLGHGRSPDLRATTGRSRLVDLFTGLPPGTAGADLHEALRPVLAAADRVLGGAVAPVHVAVLLRQLWETAIRPAGRPAPLLQRAERRGRGPLELATQRGALGHLLRPQPETDPEHRSARTALVAGAAR